MIVTLPERETITEKPIEVRVLERAALIIEEHGHCTGVLFKTKPDESWSDVIDKPINDPKARYCELGAIWRAGYELGLLPLYWRDISELAANKWEDEEDGDGYTIIGEIAGLTEFGAVEDIHQHNDRVRSPAVSAEHLRKLAREWQSTKS